MNQPNKQLQEEILSHNDTKWSVRWYFICSIIQCILLTHMIIGIIVVVASSDANNHCSSIWNYVVTLTVLSGFSVFMYFYDTYNCLTKDKIEHYRNILCGFLIPTGTAIWGLMTFFKIENECKDFYDINYYNLWIFFQVTIWLQFGISCICIIFLTSFGIGMWNLMSKNREAFGIGHLYPSSKKSTVNISTQHPINLSVQHSTVQITTQQVAVQPSAPNLYPPLERYDPNDIRNWKKSEVQIPMA
jgi:hypothetical protein